MRPWIWVFLLFWWYNGDSIVCGGGLSLVVRMSIENFCYATALEQWYFTIGWVNSVIIVCSGLLGQLECKFNFRLTRQLIIHSSKYFRLLSLCDMIYFVSFQSTFWKDCWFHIHNWISKNVNYGIWRLLNYIKIDDEFVRVVLEQLLTPLSMGVLLSFWYTTYNQFTCTFVKYEIVYTF